MTINIGGKPRGRRKQKKARAIRPSKKIEMVVRRRLFNMAIALGADVAGVQNILQSGDLAAIDAVLNQLQEKWRDIYGRQGIPLTDQWIAAISARQKAEFERNMTKALGVDYTSVFDDERVRQAAEASAFEAANLIKTIPDEYFDDVRRAVISSYQQTLPEGRTLADILYPKIEDAGKRTQYRAHLIARDQTSKINVGITQARCQSVGIEEYIWRTANDARVAGNPSGLYPPTPSMKASAAHGNHYARNGKKYRFDDPPPDGPPGWGINCRCVSEPVIDMDKLRYA